MYAIVKTGGKQYRVERGQQLLVERLAAEEGASVSLQPILYRSDEPVFDKAGLESVTVTATVLGHVRGEKLRVFKFKPKRGYKRRTGHRQELTRIEVTEIATGGHRAAAKTTAKPVGAKPGAAEATTTAARPAKPKARAASRPKPGPDEKPKAGAAEKRKAGAAEQAKAGSPEKPKAKAKPKAKVSTSKEKAGDGS